VALCGAGCTQPTIAAVAHTRKSFRRFMPRPPVSLDR
jgi:hypothetical protein